MFNPMTYLNEPEDPRTTPEQRAAMLITEFGLVKALQIALRDAASGRELDNDTRQIYTVLWSASNDR